MNLRHVTVLTLITVLGFISYSYYWVKQTPNDHALIESIEQLASYHMSRNAFEEKLQDKFGNLEILKKQINKSKFQGRSLNGKIEIPAYHVLYYVKLDQIPPWIRFVTYAFSVVTEYNNENELMSIEIFLTKQVF